MAAITTTPVGKRSIETLGALLDETRQGDRLAPATVICQTSAMTVAVRRAVGRRRQGLAGVTFVTLQRFAEDLVAPELFAQQRHIAARSEVVAAVRAELHRNPGGFGSVAGHRTTEERLVTLYGEIVGLPSDALERVRAQASGLSAEALRVLDGGLSQMQAACSGDEVVERALAALDRMPVGERGPILLYLLDPIRPYEGRVFKAVAARAESHVVVGLTGHRRIDKQHFDRLSGWGVRVEGASTHPRPGRLQFDSDPASGGDETSFEHSHSDSDQRADTGENRAVQIEVADPEDEVRTALRDVVAFAASGEPLNEMAILYASAEPYARLLSEHLESAGLPYSSAGHRPLSSSLAGRTLHRLLTMSAQGADRVAVTTLLNAAPINDGTGNEAPAALWDRISRQAGVIDSDQWAVRLDELVRNTDDEASQTSMMNLAQFMVRLQKLLTPPADRTWTRWSQWGVDLLDELLLGAEIADGTLDQGPELPRQEPGTQTGERPSPAWPQVEHVAFEQVRKILKGMAALDAFGQAPTLDSFESTIATELEATVVPGQPMGKGVYVGPLGATPGHSYTKSVVVGLVEGHFPRTPREDPLLSDQLRAASRVLPEKSDLAHLDVRLVALAVAASHQPAVLLTSRGDMRSNRSRVWPRVLDPLVGSWESIDSHYQGLAGHGRPISADEFGLRALIAHVEGNEPIDTHELARIDEALAANLDRVRDRSRPVLTRHAGSVQAGKIDPTERLLSPTALETYAQCPRKYLFARVLRVGEDERPERIDEIQPRERGTLVHAVLERFITEAIEELDVPEPGDPWSPDRRARLFDILEEEIKVASGRGITGGQVRTKLLHRWLVSEMANFLDQDDVVREQFQSTPRWAEYGFGQQDSPPLEGSWAGRKMRLRGSVDRVDLTADGGLLVIDYKGGSARPFEGMETNPLNDGRRLQLPLYARAVAEKENRPGRKIGVYWLTRENKLKTMELDEELETSLESAVGSALDGIRDGLFPGVPGDAVGWPRLTFENCMFCDFDRVCPTDRQSEWERVRVDESLTPIDLLLGRQRTSAEEIAQ